MTLQDTTYMWIPINNGTVIIDEMCKCGHKRSEHNDTATMGHGSCKNQDCECWKFTWHDFITIPNPNLKHG